MWRTKKVLLFAPLRINFNIPEEWSHSPTYVGEQSLLKWPHSAPRLWKTVCLNYSWQSLSSTQHPFANRRVATFRFFFVVVHLKCIAGCLCYWNTDECSKWLPLMPIFALWPLFWRTKNSYCTWYMPSLFCFPQENERMNCGLGGIQLSIIVIIFD